MRLGIFSEQILRYIKWVILWFHSEKKGRYPVLKYVNTFLDILYTLHETVAVDGHQQKKRRNIQT